jgi:hypothetical protein
MFHLNPEPLGWAEGISARLHGPALSGKGNSMGDNTAIRQALLKSAFKHLYPTIRPNEWLPASVLLAEVNAISRGRGAGRPVARHALDPKHFAFRGMSSAGATEVARELRIVRKNRQRPRDQEPPASDP